MRRQQLFMMATVFTGVVILQNLVKSVGRATVVNQKTPLVPLNHTLTLAPNKRRRKKQRKSSSITNSTFVQKLERPSLINLWSRRIRPQVGGFLFHKHIRKAGGTSLRAYFEKVLRYHNITIVANDQQRSSKRPNGKRPNSKRPSKSKQRPFQTNSNVVYYEQEFAAMDWQCPEIDDRWKNTLSIIALRHPMERHLSEFFYSGTRSQDTPMGIFHQFHATQNYTGEFFSILETKFQEWLLDGMNEVASKGLLGRHFTDEFQVRALTGETTEMPKPRPDSCNHQHQVPGCQIGPCNYGKGYKGGTNAWHSVTNTTLQRAKHVLDQFDIVLLTETMKEQAEFLGDVFGVPFGSISESNKNRNKVHQSLILEGMQRKLPGTFKILKSLCRYEMELYKHAVQINQQLIKQWKREKIIMNS